MMSTLSLCIHIKISRKKKKNIGLICVQINKCQTPGIYLTHLSTHTHPQEEEQQQKNNRSLNKEPQIIKETNIHFKQLLQKANEVPFNNTIIYTYTREKTKCW